MAAVLLCQGQGGKKQSQQNQILLRASELFAQSIPRELPGLLLTRSHTGTAVGSFPCPWGLGKGGVLLRRVSPSRSRALVAPLGYPRLAQGRRAGGCGHRSQGCTASSSSQPSPVIPLLLGNFK